MWRSRISFAMILDGRIQANALINLFRSISVFGKWPKNRLSVQSDSVIFTAGGLSSGIEDVVFSCGSNLEVGATTKSPPKFVSW
jgi:hypothetical protein